MEMGYKHFISWLLFICRPWLTQTLQNALLASKLDFILGVCCSADADQIKYPQNILSFLSSFDGILCEAACILSFGDGWRCGPHGGSVSSVCSAHEAQVQTFKHTRAHIDTHTYIHRPTIGQSRASCFMGTFAFNRLKGK